MQGWIAGIVNLSVCVVFQFTLLVGFYVLYHLELAVACLFRLEWSVGVLIVQDR